MPRSSRHRHKKRSITTRSSSSKKKLSLILVFGLFLILSLFVFLFFKVLNLDKFAYINKTTDGSAEIIVVDSKNDRIVKYLISSDTELDSSRNLGEYKLGSLWILGDKEGYGGKLVSETISKNYFLPIYLWSDGVKTNMSVYQKIKSFFVNKQNVGYEETFTSQKLSNSVLINFVNPKMAESIVKVDIEDLTGTVDTAPKLAKIMEIMGAKITSNSKGYDEKLDCEIIGKDYEVAKIVSDNFDCKLILDKNLSVDLKIKLGAAFAQRF